MTESLETVHNNYLQFHKSTPLPHSPPPPTNLQIIPNYTILPNCQIGSQLIKEDLLVSVGKLSDLIWNIIDGDYIVWIYNTVKVTATTGRLEDYSW